MALNLSMFNGQSSKKKSGLDTSMFETPKATTQAPQQDTPQVTPQQPQTTTTQRIPQYYDTSKSLVAPQPSFEDENIVVYGSGKTEEQESKKPILSTTDRLKKFFDPGVKKTETGKQDYLTSPTDIRDTTSKERIEKLETPNQRGFVAGFEQPFSQLGGDKEYIKEVGEQSPDLFTLSTSTQKAPEYMEDNQRKLDVSMFDIGRGVGEVGKQLLSYGMASKAVAGKEFGKALVSKLPAQYQNAASTILADQIVDNIAQTPQNVANLIDKDTSLAEDAKSLLWQNVLDLAINTGIATFAGIIKGANSNQLKQAVESKPEMVDIIKENAPDQLEAIVKTDPNIARAVEVQPVESIKRSEDVLQPIRQEPTSLPLEAPRQDFELDIPIRQAVDDALPKPIEQVVEKTKKQGLIKLPKKQSDTIADKFRTIYRENVTKMQPIEYIAKKTDDDLLRAKATNINRLTGSVDYNLTQGQTNMTGDTIGKSVQDIFSNVKSTDLEGLQNYAWHKHNIDRVAQGKPVFGDDVTADMSRQIVDQYEKTNPDFKNVQEEITNYLKTLTREWGVNSGLVAKESADLWDDLYKNYVPTHRFVDVDKQMMSNSGQFVGKMFKGAKGSSKDIIPLDQQLAMATDKIIRNARKNELMLDLAKSFENNPQISSKYVKGIKETPFDKVDDVMKMGNELEAEAKREGSNYLINFYDDGKMKQMIVRPELHDALKTFEKDSLDNFLDGVRKYATNPFKQLITQKNPIFAVRNIMRDVPTALTYSNDPISLVKNVPKAGMEMLSNGDLWKQYQAMGGTRQGFFNYDKGVKFEFMGEKGTKEKILNTFKKAGDKVEALNNFTETLPRFSEYVASIEKGDSPALALMKSAELTTDFARFGRQAKRADAVVPYLNASIQGLDKFGRQLGKRPIKTMTQGGVVVTVPALILDQVNKNNEAYNQMSSRERNQYFHIPKKDGTFYRIPRAREVGALLGTTFEWISRASRGEEVTIDEIMEVAKENFTPVNGFDSNILRPAKNFWDIVSGKDPDAKNYFGSKIVPTKLQKYSPEMQYDEKTTSIAKNLGAYLDISPKAIDYLFDAYSGVIGDVAMPYLTEEKTDPLAPIKRSFIADPVYKSDAQNNFYDLLDSMSKLSQDFNREYEVDSKAITPYELERNRLTKISKALSKLREEQKQATSKGDDKKARGIRQDINELSNKATEEALTEAEMKQKIESFLKWNKSKYKGGK